MNCRICFFVSLLMALSAACSGNPEPYVLELDGVRWVRMESERLPDMSIPRHCHVLLDLNGEFTAIGGHTTGFVITRSGEYFKDGKWHALAPFYTHDDPFCSLMSDGRVLLDGGYERTSAWARPGARKSMIPLRTSPCTCPFWTRSARTPTR